MARIRMENCQAIVQFEHDLDRTLPATLAEIHPTQGTAMWTAALAKISDMSLSQIDWLITI